MEIPINEYGKKEHICGTGQFSLDPFLEFRFPLRTIEPLRAELNTPNLDVRAVFARPDQPTSETLDHSRLPVIS